MCVCVCVCVDKREALWLLRTLGDGKQQFSLTAVATTGFQTLIVSHNVARYGAVQNSGFFARRSLLLPKAVSAPEPKGSIHKVELCPSLKIRCSQWRAGNTQSRVFTFPCQHSNRRSNLHLTGWFSVQLLWKIITVLEDVVTFCLITTNCRGGMYWCMALVELSAADAESWPNFRSAWWWWWPWWYRQFKKQIPRATKRPNSSNRLCTSKYLLP